LRRAGRGGAACSRIIVRDPPATDKQSAACGLSQRREGDLIYVLADAR